MHDNSIYKARDEMFLPKDELNSTSEIMALTVDSVAWGIGCAWMDPDTMEAHIAVPTTYNTKTSAATLLVNELYAVMVRKGANVVYYEAPINVKEEMGSISFYRAPFKDKSTYFRFSEQYMSTIVTRAYINSNIPKSTEGYK